MGRAEDYPCLSFTLCLVREHVMNSMGCPDNFLKKNGLDVSLSFQNILES